MTSLEALFTFSSDDSTNDTIGILHSGSKEQREIANAILEWHKDLVFTFKTSGSTGTPKDISFSKDQIIASISQSQEAFNLTSEDVALLCLPMRYVAGKIMLFRALHIGMDVVSIEPKLSLKEIVGKPVSFAAFIPSQVQEIINTEDGKRWLQSIRVVIIGGATISNALEEVLKQFTNKIYHTYGMTETLTHIALRLLSGGGQEYFKALPHISLSTKSDSTLNINAKHLGVNIETNDVVELIGENKFKIIGRIDNVINSGGLKIHPEEIEKVLKKYILNDLIIAGHKDDKWGEKVVLIIESDNPIDPEWIKVAYEEIPNNKRPKEIKYVSKFSRTESGKIKRKAIV